jgi:hypothetical protein
MKTPFGTLTFIIFAVIAVGVVLIFQAVAHAFERRPEREKFKFSLEIGKSPDEFVEFKDEKGAKRRFDEVLRRLEHKKQYYIRYKRDPNTDTVEDYTPPRNVSIKTDNVTIAALAKNEPPGDPSVTKKVQSNNVADIQNVLNSLKN